MKKYIFCLVVITTMMLSACGTSGESSSTSLQMLNDNAQMYEDQTVTVQGTVVEIVGESVQTITLPQITTTCPDGQLGCTSVTMSMSEIKVYIFVLESSGQRITVYQKSGGVYPQLAYTSPQDGSPQGELVLTGMWKVNTEGKHALYVEK